MIQYAKEAIGMDFLEIEHKFVLPENWCLASFSELVISLGPQHSNEIAVEDRYYVTKVLPGHVYRHRIDEEIQHLTVKSLELDSAVRLEVNLDLGLHKGDQAQSVDAFLRPLGLLWKGVLHKQVRVFYFADAEIVHYTATYKDKKISCVEIEAKKAVDVDTALSIIDSYTDRLSLDRSYRSDQSLFHLLLADDMPTISDH